MIKTLKNVGSALRGQIQHLPEGEGEGGGFVLLALLTFLPSVISSFFNQNKGGGSPPGPSPRSATGLDRSCFVVSCHVNMPCHRGKFRGWGGDGVDSLDCETI